jgi:hypothetical protein
MSRLLALAKGQPWAETSGRSPISTDQKEGTIGYQDQQTVSLKMGRLQDRAMVWEHPVLWTAHDFYIQLLHKSFAETP